MPSSSIVVYVWTLFVARKHGPQVQQVAGCRLPDDAGAWHILHTAQAPTGVSGLGCSLNWRVGGLGRFRVAIVSIGSGFKV